MWVVCGLKVQDLGRQHVLVFFRSEKSSVGTGTPHVDLPKVIRNKQTINYQFSQNWMEGRRGKKQENLNRPSRSLSWWVVSTLTEDFEVPAL